ncbi:MAG: O-antigen ligase family protein [Sphingobacteriaceae bacterium]|nr:O-antigen ligase family protein [Sphingobacteriaceae bacterium]
MVKYIRAYIFEILIFSYIVGNAYVLVNQKDYFYQFNMIPVAVIMAYIAIFHLQRLVFFLAFATPLSISLKELHITEALDMSLPSEPIMIVIMLLYIFNDISFGITDKKFFKHPITILILIQLSWILITSFTSSDVVVSVKFLISRLWFVFSCYVIMPILFKNRDNIIRFVLCYGSGLLIVVIITTIKHAAFNFNDKASDWIVSPFYNDHTAYGAALAMFFPVTFGILLMKNISPITRIYTLCLFLVFSLGLVLSFARASWLSLVICVGILFTLALGFKFRTLLISFIIIGSLFYAFQTEILIALGRNNTDAEGGFANNIESVTNISTDASNLERLNRWSCAIRMFEDKPLMGWGPGTYMFKYAPYQLSREKTIISTNFGTNGNAHSEYLGPLAEQGILGLVIMLVLLLYTTSLGYKLTYSLQDRDDKILLISIFVGIMSYLIHGFLNNFLDTDKLSLPFWAYLAVLVTMDIYYTKKPLSNKA